MFREQWFTTPVWIDHFSGDTKSLAQSCIQLKENGFANRVFTNKGGWQSHDFNLSNYSEFEEIENFINTKIASIVSDIGDPNLHLVVNNAWININEKGDYNDKHVHPLSAFSGVIYLQVDEDSGSIRFFDDIHTIKHYPIKINPYNNLFHHTVEYKPTNGMILLFPSWIPHDVTPSNSELTRVSIAFNIRQI